MDGVSEKISGDIIVLEIQNLSDELKEKIKAELVTICYGEYGLVSSNIYHTFNATIKELVEERLPACRNGQVGAVGELLLNVLIRVFTDLRVISPFFNLEERNVKKGFDIIAIDSDNMLWIIESKAGEPNRRYNTATKKVCERINVARTDLDKRLNQYNSQLWCNAINSVKCALVNNDEQATILNLLNVTSESCLSNDKNVVLGGTVFCVLDSIIDEVALNDLYNSIIRADTFLRVKLIVIQKRTYQAIIDYLELLLEEV